MQGIDIKSLLGKDAHFQVNKKVAKLVGVEAAVLLSYLIDKDGYFEKQNAYTTRDGKNYFYLLSKDIEEETTLSYRVQKKCIESLEENGFIETKLMSVPRKLYFTLCELHICEKVIYINAENATMELPKTQLINKEQINKEESIKEVEVLISEQTELLTSGFEPSTSTSFLNGNNKPVEKTTQAKEQAEQEPILTSTSNTPLPPADRVQAVLRKGLGRDGLDEILNQTDIPFPDLVAIFIDYWVYQQGRTFNAHQHKGMASSFQKWFEIGKGKELPKIEIKNGIKSNPLFEKIVERVERMKVGIQMTKEQSSAIKKFLNENPIGEDILLKTTRDFCDGTSNDWNVWLKIAQRNAKQLLVTK